MVKEEGVPVVKKPNKPIEHSSTEKTPSLSAEVINQILNKLQEDSSTNEDEGAYYGNIKVTITHYSVFTSDTQTMNQNHLRKCCIPGKRSDQNTRSPCNFTCY